MSDALRIREVFNEAFEVSGSARAECLERACAGDPVLRRRVEELLAAAEKEDEFLASPTGNVPDSRSTRASPLREAPGTRIGPYKLLQQIGEGGFGVVFLAEQEKPVKRRVALKIIKLGMDTHQVVARFEQERQALAMMEHPNIAKVFDAGATETGRPYFVMELVKGDPITHYCDSNNLSVEERLGLAQQVCHAIQHAHQKGIIHRDIKPNNVLVTVADGKPIPKVIDFGIAKATLSKLTEKTLFTEHRALIGTPEYMSPEQAEMTGVDIDTRSDIYSLGVLLYELLTGALPFDGKRLRSAAFGEIQRIIREEDPPTPSTRLSTLETLANVAAHRRTEPARLSRLVKGDLDWIVMKCLEKDRTRRYETANGLAADIQRHLDDEPVTAAAPSTGYKLRKFVKRNRAQVIAAGIVAGALVLGVLGATAGMIWAIDEKDRADVEKNKAALAAESEAAAKLQAQANLDLALQALDQIYIDQAEGHPKIREGLPEDMLEKGLGFYEQFVKENGGNKRLVYVTGIAYHRAGLIFRELGKEERAVESLEEAVSAYDRAIQIDPRDPRIHDDRSGALYQLGRFEDALAASDQALAIDPRHTGALCSRGLALHNLKRFEEALAAYDRALAIDPRLRAANLNRSVTLNDGLGRFEEALESSDRAVRVNPRDADAHYSRGNSLNGLGCFEEALAAYDQALEIDPRRAHTHSNRGNALNGLRRFEEALWAYDRALVIDPRLVPALLNRGNALHCLGRREEALAAYDRALVIDPRSAAVHTNRGTQLHDAGRFDDALAACDLALQIDPRFALAYVARGKTLGDGLWRFAEAIEAYLEAIRLRPDDADAHAYLGLALTNTGQVDVAIHEYREVIRLRPNHVMAHNNLGILLMEQGDTAGSIREGHESVRLDPDNFVSHLNLANALLAASDFQGAAASFGEAIRLEPDRAESHYVLANTLDEGGDPGSAIESFHEAIRLRPDYAEAHCNLGHALKRLGRFQEAITSLRTGHELGSKRADWKYPSARWIENAERRAKLAQQGGRLDQVLAGEAPPRDALERIEFALTLRATARHAESARMYAGAFDEDAALAEDLAQNYRYNAACSAALAATPGREDAAEWRGRALEWLRADLAARAKAVTGLAAMLEHWKTDPDFASVRDRVGDLPEAERAAWSELWAAVDLALAAARQAAK